MLSADAQFQVRGDARTAQVRNMGRYIKVADGVSDSWLLIATAAAAAAASAVAPAAAAARPPPPALPAVPAIRTVASGLHSEPNCHETTQNVADRALRVCNFED